MRVRARNQAQPTEGGSGRVDRGRVSGEMRSHGGTTGKVVTGCACCAETARMPRQLRCASGGGTWSRWSSPGCLISSSGASIAMPVPVDIPRKLGPSTSSTEKSPNKRIRALIKCASDPARAVRKGISTPGIMTVLAIAPSCGKAKRGHSSHSLPRRGEGGHRRTREGSSDHERRSFRQRDRPM